MEILGPDIFKIVQDYAMPRTDYEYFLRYKDYTNAIIIKLKEKDYKEVISLVNKKYDHADINWGKILGVILDTDFRDYSTIVKILLKTEDYSYFVASLIKHDMLDCFRTVFKHVPPVEADLFKYTKGLGYNFNSENYHEFDDDVYDKFQYILSYRQEVGRDEKVPENIDIDIYHDLEEFKDGVMEGLAEINYKDLDQKTVDECVEYQDSINNNDYNDVPKDYFNVSDYMIDINGGTVLVGEDQDEDAFDSNAALVKAGYSDDIKEMINRINTVVNDYCSNNDLVDEEEDFVDYANMDPNTIENEDVKELRNKSVMYVLTGAALSNRYDVCEKLLDMLQGVDIASFDIGIFTSSIFYEQRMRIPLLFLQFIRQNSDSRDIIIDDYITTAKRCDNVALLTYMYEIGLKYTNAYNGLMNSFGKHK